MITQINIIKKCNNPEILVLTPLLPKHAISREIKKILKKFHHTFYF